MTSNRVKNVGNYNFPLCLPFIISYFLALSSCFLIFPISQSYLIQQYTSLEQSEKKNYKLELNKKKLSLITDAYKVIK